MHKVQFLFQWEGYFLLLLFSLVSSNNGCISFSSLCTVFLGVEVNSSVQQRNEILAVGSDTVWVQDTTIVYHEGGNCTDVDMTTCQSAEIEGDEDHATDLEDLQAPCDASDKDHSADLPATTWDTEVVCSGNCGSSGGGENETIGVQEATALADNEGTIGNLNDTSMHHQALASSGGRESVTSVQEADAVADTGNMDDQEAADYVDRGSMDDQALASAGTESVTSVLEAAVVVGTGSMDDQEAADVVDRGSMDDQALASAGEDSVTSVQEAAAVAVPGSMDDQEVAATVVDPGGMEDHALASSPGGESLTSVQEAAAVVDPGTLDGQDAAAVVDPGSMDDPEAAAVADQGSIDDHALGSSVGGESVTIVQEAAAVADPGSRHNHEGEDGASRNVSQGNPTRIHDHSPFVLVHMHRVGEKAPVIHLHVAVSGIGSHGSEQTKVASAVHAASNTALVGYSSSEDSMDGDSAK
jgi:hypothetical protein